MHGWPPADCLPFGRNRCWMKDGCADSHMWGDISYERSETVSDHLPVQSAEAGARRGAVHEPQVCPLLGLRRDKTTHCSFATVEHRCHKGGAPAAVAIGRQQQHCLTTDFVACPAYQGTEPVGSIPSRKDRPLLFKLGVGGAVAVLLGLGVATVALAKLDARGAGSAPVAMAHPGGTGGTVGQLPQARSDEVRAAESRPATTAQTGEPRTDTSHLRYQVKEGDTLESISYYFGAKVGDILLVNNLYGDQPVKPGQVLMIPR